MRRYSVTVGGQKREVAIEERAGASPGAERVAVVVDGQERVLEVRPVPGGGLSWLDGNRVVTAEVQVTPAAGAVAAERRRLTVSTAGETLVAEVADAAVELAAVLGAGGGRAGSGPLTMRAPMPGRVVKLLAKPGDAVKAGQGVVVVEAMKMENELRAPRDAKVREMKVAEGAAVEAGEPLAILE